MVITGWPITAVQSAISYRVYKCRSQKWEQNESCTNGILGDCCYFWRSLTIVAEYSKKVLPGILTRHRRSITTACSGHSSGAWTNCRSRPLWVMAYSQMQCLFATWPGAFYPFKIRSLMSFNKIDCCILFYVYCNNYYQQWTTLSVHSDVGRFFLTYRKLPLVSYQWILSLSLAV